MGRMNRYIRASDVRRRQTKYVFHGCLRAGQLNLLGGTEGIGKSQLLCMATAEETRGGGIVLFSTREDDHEEEVRPRLEAAGADLDRVILERAVRTFPDDADRLEDEIDAFGVTLALFEPVVAHMSRPSLSMGPMRAFADSLAGVARTTRCTIVASSHLLKRPSRTMSPLHAVLGGAGGLGAVVPSALLFGRNPGDSDEILLATTKRRRGAPVPALAFEIDTVDLPAAEGQIALPDVERLVCVGERDVSAQEILAGMGDTPVSSPTRHRKRSAAAEWLTRYLFLAPDHQMLGDVVKSDALRAGHSPATLRRAREQLGVIVDTMKLPGFATGTTSVWRLPDGLVELQAEEGTP